MKVIGIVGHEGAKFTPAAEATARQIIVHALNRKDAVLTSGHCHLGGIDIWAEEVARALGCFDERYIFAPQQLRWEPRGYKQRNILIAEACTSIHNIVVATLPPGYRGMRFTTCYHCARFADVPPHVKSGGCWTARHALRLGKPAVWHVVDDRSRATVAISPSSPGT